jgi:hypothetical protein
MLEGGRSSTNKLGLNRALRTHESTNPLWQKDLNDTNDGTVLPERTTHVFSPHDMLHDDTPPLNTLESMNPAWRENSLCHSNPSAAHQSDASSLSLTPLVDRTQHAEGGSSLDYRHRRQTSEDVHAAQIVGHDHPSVSRDDENDGNAAQRTSDEEAPPSSAVREDVVEETEDVVVKNYYYSKSSTTFTTTTLILRPPWYDGPATGPFGRIPGHLFDVFKALFKLGDRNGDGAISTTELTILLKRRARGTALQGDFKSMVELNSRMVQQHEGEEHPSITLREFAIGIYEAVLEDPSGHVATWIWAEFRKLLPSMKKGEDSAIL